MPIDNVEQNEEQALALPSLEAPQTERTGSPFRLTEIDAIEELPGEVSVEQGLRLRNELAEQAAINAGLELARIKKILAGEEAKRKHAQRAAAHAQRQMKMAEADGNRLHGELARTREQLALARDQRANELRLAAERESAVMAELVETRHQASTVRDSASGYRNKWLAISLGISVCALLWMGFHSYVPGALQAVSDSPSEGAETATRSGTAAGSGAAAGGWWSDRGKASEAVAVKAGPPDFGDALGNLDEALGRFRGESPQEVLSAVHRENAARGISVCSFEWNGGQVSLMFGGAEKEDPQTAIQRCADAVGKAGAK